MQRVDGNAMRAHYLLELRKFIAGYRNIPKNVCRVWFDEADFFEIIGRDAL